MVVDDDREFDKFSIAFTAMTYNLITLVELNILSNSYADTPDLLITILQNLDSLERLNVFFSLTDKVAFGSQEEIAKTSRLKELKLWD